MPASVNTPTRAAAPPHRSREVIIAAGLALARPLDPAQVYAEAARQARRALGATAAAVAVLDDDTAALRLAHHEGWRDADADALQRRLAPAWLEALATERVVTRVVTHDAPNSSCAELSAPVVTADGALGALTVQLPAAPASDASPRDGSPSDGSPSDGDDTLPLLVALAAQTAAALDRAWLARRVEQKRRFEAIGEVTAGVAHELRNPLFGISSAAQLLGFRAAGDADVQKHVGRILREVERLNHMVGELLDFGRPRPTRRAPGDPDALWDDVLDAERARVAARALTVVRVDPRAARRAPRRDAWLVDAEQLRQVWLNLLGNAVDASPEGGTLTLTTAVLPSGAWRMRLHNGGAAIDAAALPRVFELFYSTKTGGTGIGLALCQRVLDEHGGTIAVESAPDAGTAVTVTLPPAPSA